MSLYNKTLNSSKYLEVARRIGEIKFITDGKWDWEHGLGHYKRVSSYARTILLQLGADKRTVELGMVAGLLHDVGLIKGDKVDHALESSKMFGDFIDKEDINESEYESLRQAIEDHSSGNNIESLIGLALVLADKLDVTHHRTDNSSIHDEMNNEIQKIKNVNIRINSNKLTVGYTTCDGFNVNIFTGWPKAITIPYKVSKYLNKEYVLLINGRPADVSKFTT